MTERFVHDETEPVDGPVLAFSRRGVLSSAVAVSALAFAPAVSATATGRTGRLRAVFDRAVPQAVAFAGRTRERGLATFGFAGDMSKLWFDRVLPGLREDSGPLVGLTGTGALFCFEQLAWDVGMRVRLRVDHGKALAGFTHFPALDLPSSALSRLRAADAAFGESAADVALDYQAAWGDCTHMAGGAGELVTWVIAPLTHP